jgi:hypothetical protein
MEESTLSVEVSGQTPFTSQAENAPGRDGVAPALLRESAAPPVVSGRSFQSKEQPIMTSTASDSSSAAQALRQSSHPALRRLALEESDSAIVITGRVSTYYLKQMAQEAVMPMRGVRILINRVTVAGE